MFYNWDCQDATDMLIHLSLTVPHLERLRLPSLQATFISPIIAFNSLKYLHVSRIDTPSCGDNWKFLCIYCPNLEKLTIRRVENNCLPNAQVESVLMKTKKVKELCFGNMFDVDEQLLNIIKTTGKNLRKLTIFSNDTELCRSNVTRIHSNGLNVYVKSSDEVFNDEEEKLIDESGFFNNIENVDAFIHTRVIALTDEQRRMQNRMRIQLRVRRRQNGDERVRFMRRRMENDRFALFNNMQDFLEDDDD
jgi:hypothetical protein